MTGEAVNLFPKIGGRAIALWDLYRAVTEQDEGAQTRDWQRVAEFLNIDWIAYPDAPSKLEKCFEDNLGDFERARVELNMDDDDDDDEDVEEEIEDSQSDVVSHTVDVQTLRSTVPSERLVPSSPPVVGGYKRPRPSSLLLSDPAYPSDSSRKRRRLDRGGEIPSTPDDDAELVGTRGSGTATRMRKTEESPSSQQLPSLPERRRRRFFEPETQDFGYDPETQAYPTVEDEEDVPDITPSQQLRSESPHVTPIPFSLSKRQTGKQADNSGGFSKNPSVKQEPVSSPSHVSGPATRLSPSEMSAAKPTRRSLPKTYKPATNIAFNRPNEYRTTESPRNRVVMGQTTTSREIDGQHPSTETREVQHVQQAQAGPAPGSVEEVVEHFMSLGYPQKIILYALKATTLKPGYPMTLVLEKLQNGEGIPEYHEGVWTARDDESLRFIIDYEKMVAGGAVNDERRMRKKAERELKRLTVKHKEDGVKERREYFAMLAV